MFGRREIFGKRRMIVEEPKQNGSTESNQVFDRELWDGEHGEFLRSMGYAPDDPKNQLTLQEPVAARLAQDDASLSEILKGLNKIAPYPIGAFTLLREELWHGRFGAFLLHHLDLSPFRPWNVIFLPLDSAGAAHLRLPIGRQDSRDIAEIEMLIEPLAELFSGRSSPEAAALAAACDETAISVPFLFPREIRDYSPAVRDARRHIRSLAFMRAMTTRFSGDAVIASQMAFLDEPELQLVA